MQNISTHNQIEYFVLLYNVISYCIFFAYEFTKENDAEIHSYITQCLVHIV